MPKITGEDLLRLARDAKKMQLRSIRLAESSSKLGVLKAGKLPTKGTQSVKVGLNADPDKSRAEIVATFKLALAYDEPGDSDPAVAVSATFVLSYNILKSIPKKNLEDTVPRTSMTVVWPYWREFVQSMTVRMGLPAYPVALMNLVDFAGLPKEGEEQKSP